LDAPPEDAGPAIAESARGGRGGVAAIQASLDAGPRLTLENRSPRGCVARIVLPTAGASGLVGHEARRT